MKMLRKLLYFFSQILWLDKVEYNQSVPAGVTLLLPDKVVSVEEIRRRNATGINVGFGELRANWDQVK